METVADSVTGDLPDPEICSCEEALALREEIERLRAQVKAHDDALEQGRAFWNQVDEGHPAFELLERLAASTWQTSDLALPRAVKDYVGGVMLDRENPDLLEYPCNCQYCQRDWVGEMAALRQRVRELEDLGYAGALKLATAYADLNAVEGRLREAVGLLTEAKPLWQEWRDTDITEDEDRWVAFTDRAHAWHDKVCAFLASAQPAEPGRLEREMARLGLHHVGETNADLARREPKP